MNGYQHFTPGEISLLDKALEISEDVTCNHYHISAGNWKKYGFEVSNLVQLQEEEITPYGLAQIARYVHPFPFRIPTYYPRDYYRICLQDHNILRVVDRNDGIELFPLMVYVLTHELVHVIRFRKFMQRFDVDQEEKAVEEGKVHQATYQILKPLKGIKLNPIFDSYLGHRCQTELY
ncbi:MAG: hypothetical protein HY879_08925 [Deltaproteobacteria bacterium]|nr:hypothetical protein [Deltaproteobacteria bacterium]